MCATHYTRVSPWGHAHPREPGHTATRGRARLRGLSALRAARQGHTRPRSLTPTPRRRRFRARVPAPPGNLTGRAGMSSRRRPPPLNSLQMPGGPRSRLRRAPALGRPLQVAGGQLRGRGLGCATGKGRGFSRSPAPCLSWAPGGGLREAALPAPRGFQAKARDPPWSAHSTCWVATPPGCAGQDVGVPRSPPLASPPVSPKPAPTTRCCSASLAPVAQARPRHPVLSEQTPSFLLGKQRGPAVAWFQSGAGISPKSRATADLTGRTAGPGPGAGRLPRAPAAGPRGAGGGGRRGGGGGGRGAGLVSVPAQLLAHPQMCPSAVCCAVCPGPL